MSKIYVGDVPIFDLNAQDPNQPVIDLTGYTLKMEFLKPNGASVEKTAALKPGSTTVVRYETIAGDIDLAGTWKVQSKVTLSGKSYRGETDEFIVYAEFN